MDSSPATIKFPPWSKDENPPGPPNGSVLGKQFSLLPKDLIGRHLTSAGPCPPPGPVLRPRPGTSHQEPDGKGRPWLAFLSLPGHHAWGRARAWLPSTSWRPPLSTSWCQLSLHPRWGLPGRQQHCLTSQGLPQAGPKVWTLSRQP